MLVRDLMSPITCVVSVAQTLGSAAQRLSTPDRAALMLNLRREPAGIVTREDLAALAESDPAGWRRRLCARLCPEEVIRLREDDPVQSVLWRYRQETAMPLLVCDGTDPVGILYPEDVYRWSHHHDTSPAMPPTLRSREPYPRPDACPEGKVA